MKSFSRLKKSMLSAVRSSVFASAALFLADGLWAKIKGSSINESEHLSGVNIDDDYNYATQVASYYLKDGDLSGRVAEIGPGGSAAVALHLLAHGAQSVDLLDRFAFSHEHGQLDALYHRFENYEQLDKVNFHVGEEASAERFFARNRGYDGIFSCAVFEHLSDPIRALRAIIAALEPGGRTMHQIDLRDHGMFSSAGKHELTFLTIPDLFYRPMSEPRGRPNRVLVDEYRDVLEESPVDYRILVTSLVGVGQLIEPVPVEEVRPDLLDRARESVAAYRPRLIKRFRDKAVDDLVVSSARVEATKRP